MTGVTKTWGKLQTAVRSWPWRARVWVLIGATALGVAVAFSMPVEIQPESYHDFASSRLFGIANFGIVATNAAFLAVGIWGLWLIYSGKFAPPLFESPVERRPYVVFFAGAVLLAFGSGTYHADPTTGSLLWDRLAMTVVFMAYFSAFIADRVGRDLGVENMLPALLILGAASMAYWRVSDDLRLYRVVQGLPILLVPMMCLLFPGRLTRFKYVFWAWFWFGLATAFEFYDKEIHYFFSVGGHTIKHLAAAVACATVIAMLRDSARRAAAGDPAIYEGRRE
jgi:hypothetical protein